MTLRFIIPVLFVCANVCAQTLVLQGTGWEWRGTSMSDIKGEWNPPLASSNYCDGRFTIWDANTNVVLDNDSGLTWTRDADIDGKKLWTNAVAYCSNLVYAGYSDWRLPSVTELSRDEDEGATNGLVSVLDGWPSTNYIALPVGHPFVEVGANRDPYYSEDENWYWSSSSYDYEFKWGVGLDFGEVNCDLLGNTKIAWPCRGP